MISFLCGYAAGLLASLAFLWWREMKRERQRDYLREYKAQQEAYYRVWFDAAKGSDDTEGPK